MYKYNQIPQWQFSLFRIRKRSYTANTCLFSQGCLIIRAHPSSPRSRLLRQFLPYHCSPRFALTILQPFETKRADYNRLLPGLRPSYNLNVHLGDIQGLCASSAQQCVGFHLTFFVLAYFTHNLYDGLVGLSFDRLRRYC